jgi:hypothetical protein
MYKSKRKQKIKNNLRNSKKTSGDRTAFSYDCKGNGRGVYGSKAFAM